MSDKIFLYKNDAKTFVSKNLIKVIVSIAVIVLGLIFAIRKVVILQSVNDYFESASSSLFSLVSGRGSFVTLAFFMLLENLVYILLLYLCAFNNLSLYLFYLLLWNRSYRALTKAIIILLYFGIRALPFFILYLLTILLVLSVYCAHYIAICASGVRLKYGIKELCCNFSPHIPFLVGYLFAFVISLILIGIGCIFI